MVILGAACTGAPDRVVEVTSDQDFSAKLADVAGAEVPCMATWDRPRGRRFFRD